MPLHLETELARLKSRRAKDAARIEQRETFLDSLESDGARAAAEAHMDTLNSQKQSLAQLDTIIATMAADIQAASNPKPVEVNPS